MPSKTSSRPNSFLLIDTTGTAHPRGSSNPEQCHVNFAEGCHLYIAVTVTRRITRFLGSPGIAGFICRTECPQRDGTFMARREHKWANKDFDQPKEQSFSLRGNLTRM